MDTYDKTINYTAELFQYHHYYTGPTVTPNSQIYSPYDTENITTYLRL